MKYSFDVIFKSVETVIDFDSNWSNEIATPKWASMEGYLHNASVGQYSPLLVKNQVVKSVSPSGLRVLIIGIDSSLDPEIAGNFVLFEQYLGMLYTNYEFRDKHTLVYNAPSSFFLENEQQPPNGVISHDTFDNIVEMFFPNIAKDYHDLSIDGPDYKMLFKEAISHLRGVVGSRNSFSSQANELLFSSSEPLALRQPEVEALQLAAFRFCNNHDDGSSIKVTTPTSD